MKLSLFHILLATQPDNEEVDPFNPTGHYKWWQLLCREILVTLFKQRHIDHYNLVWYRENYPSGECSQCGCSPLKIKRRKYLESIGKSK